MLTLKERIEQEIAEWERLSSKKKVQGVLEKSDLSDPAIRRLIIIGGIVEDFFPELIYLTPQKSEPENATEFAPLIDFFKLLGSRRNLLNRLMKVNFLRTHKESAFTRLSRQSRMEDF